VENANVNIQSRADDKTTHNQVRLLSAKPTALVLRGLNLDRK